jgi:hypothetical protein
MFYFFNLFLINLLNNKLLIKKIMIFYIISKNELFIIFLKIYKNVKITRKKLLYV